MKDETPAASESRLVGYSSSERTLDARELAALRPARENAPKQRAKPVLREVTNGIACYCGERFGESQALEFMLHLRAEVGDDLAELERRRVHHAAYQRRRRSDPEVRTRDNLRKQELRIQNGRPCKCGCDTIVGRGEYRPGHRNRAEGAQCGTESGAKRHRNLGEKPCEECRIAARDAQRQRREDAKNGRKQSKRRRSPRVRLDDVIRLYVEEDLSIHAVATALRTRTSEISRILRENDIPVRPVGGPRRKTLVS